MVEVALLAAVAMGQLLLPAQRRQVLAQRAWVRVLLLVQRRWLWVPVRAMVHSQ